MDALLPRFEYIPTIWVYVTSIALVGFFFKFNRVMSVRNFDLLGLIALAPGLLLVSQGRHLQANPDDSSLFGYGAALETSGFYALLGVGLFFLGRLIADMLMTRRPLLEPNLSQGGLAWIGTALIVFLSAAILTTDRQGVAPPGGSEASEARLKFALLDQLPAIPSQAFNWSNADVSPPDAPGATDSASPAAANVSHQFDPLWSRIVCVLAHLAVVAGLIYIGQRHFDNAWTGVGMATLYLMLPYTAQLAGRPAHVVPAAFLVWMVAMYRHPTVAGALLGACAGLVYYPAFLIPVWGSFYSRRGIVRFAVGMGVTLGTVAGVVALTGTLHFWEHFKEMFNPFRGAGEGLWRHWHSYARLPLSVAFCCFSLGLALWPARKNLGTLLSSSAAVMLGTQFWYPDGGLLMMNWYLPLLLLTIYRPNLEHRVATTSVAARSVRRRVSAPLVHSTPA